MHSKTKIHTVSPQTMGVLSIVCGDSLLFFDKTIDQLQQNHRLRMDSSLSYRGRRDLNALYWSQTFAQDSVVVNPQKVFSTHGSFIKPLKDL